MPANDGRGGAIAELPAWLMPIVSIIAAPPAFTRDLTSTAAERQVVV